MHKSMVLAAISAVALLGAAPGVALADATLTLVIGGEGFDGPPKFAVTFDGKPLGEGSVASAIDTTKAGRFADAADKSKYIQTFSFNIPDAGFRPDGEVGIRLTNEAHGADGSKDDRELYVRSVSVNGDILPATRLAMRSPFGVEPTAMLGDYLVVSRAAVEGIAAPPDGGWPKEVLASAAPDSAGSKPDAAHPQAVDAVATPATPVTVEQARATVADDGGNPNPEAAADCGLSKSFQITGFNENSNDLTAQANKQLDGVIRAIGTQKCVVHLTGYSSTEGDYAHNALFSIERARNALAYLATHGVHFRRYSANGVGETTQFGADPNANRRVVVNVSP